MHGNNNAMLCDQVTHTQVAQQSYGKKYKISIGKGTTCFCTDRICNTHPRDDIINAEEHNNKLNYMTTRNISISTIDIPTTKTTDVKTVAMTPGTNNAADNKSPAFDKTTNNAAGNNPSAFDTSTNNAAGNKPSVYDTSTDNANRAGNCARSSLTELAGIAIVIYFFDKVIFIVRI